MEKFFSKVIEKSQESFKTANKPILDHFVDANNMVSLGSGAHRKIEDLLLIGNW